MWLSSHLLDDPSGAEAHRDAQALGAERHEALCAVADRLAAASPLLAQQYYRRAAVAWGRFGADGFARWVDLGERLAVEEPLLREAAMAYFAVSPRQLGANGVEALDEWCRLGREVAKTSPKLAGIFFRSTGGLLRRAEALRHLPAWIAAGLSLWGQHGWQGEFLAQAYFASAPRSVTALGPRTYQLWAGAGAALYPTVKEKEFFGSLARQLGRWSEDEKATFLRATLALAPASAKAAFAFYRDLPASLAALAGEARAAVLGILGKAGRHLTAAVPEVVPVAGALVKQVAAPHVAEALRLTDALAGAFPAGVPATLRILPRLYEDADPATVRAWFEAGGRIAAQNTEAGLAFFALESRTSMRVLHASSTAAALEDCQGLLRKYVHMLSGQPVSIRAVEGLCLRPPLEEFPAENEIALPMRIDVLATHEENLRLYRFLAAQLAGRREFATYEFAVPGETADPADPPGGALFAYLGRPDHPEMLEELFLLAEGVRVQHRLTLAYGGLSGEASWVALKLFEQWRAADVPTRAQMFDALYVLTLADGGVDALPAWIDRKAAALMLRLLAPLADQRATVQDSMRLALSLSDALGRSLARAARGPELDGFTLEKIGGDALLDPYLDEDEMPGSAAAPAGPAAGAGDEGAEPPEIPPLQLDQEGEEGAGGALPMSAEELKRLIESGADLRITQGTGQEAEGLGLYITDLVGKVPSEQLEALRQLLGEADEGPRRAPRRWLEESVKGQCFFYDEWDYHIADYRARWCRLHEVSLDGDSGEFFNRALGDYAQLIPEIRRQFQRIRPEMYRKVRGLEDGEDFDLNAAVEARVEVRAGRAPSGKLYVARKREERDVATLFLVDMSASTDEPLQPPGEVAPAGQGAKSARRPGSGRRIIDVTKETLVIMAEALEEIGDAYAIYGFSGHGRDNVEVYRVKSFAESLTPSVKARIGGVQPKRSTRMGTALRHSLEKLMAVSSRSKHLFLLSDGFPQDFDYGQDRRSNVYGIRDTAVALREAESAGVVPFCITVDKAGHDYLRQMCDESRYMVIEDITSLPRELPKIYQRVVRA